MGEFRTTLKSWEYGGSQDYLKALAPIARLKVSTLIGNCLTT